MMSEYYEHGTSGHGIANRKIDQAFHSLRKIVPWKTRLPTLDGPQSDYPSDNLLPKQLHLLQLPELSSIDTEFSLHNIDVRIFGDLTICDPSKSDHVPCFLGVLVFSGTLFLYEHDREDHHTLNFRRGINVQGAVVNIEEQTITLNAGVEVLIKVKDRDQTSQWYHKLFDASKGGPVHLKQKFSNPPGTCRIGKKKDVCTAATKGNTQVDQIPDAQKLPPCTNEISTHNSIFNKNPLSTIYRSFRFKSPTPVVSDENFIISSDVLLRVTSVNNWFAGKRFVQGKASLTQDFLTLTIHNEIKLVTMYNSDFERVMDEKMTIRVKNPEYVVDLKLTSRRAYDSWTPAFLKTYAFHAKCRRSFQKEPIISDDSREEKSPPYVFFKERVNKHTLQSPQSEVIHRKNSVPSPNVDPQSPILPLRIKSCFESYPLSTVDDHQDTRISSMLVAQSDPKAEDSDDDYCMALPTKLKKEPIIRRFKTSCQNFSKKLYVSEPSCSTKIKFAPLRQPFGECKHSDVTEGNVKDITREGGYACMGPSWEKSDEEENEYEEPISSHAMSK